MINYLQDVSNFKHRKSLSKLRASNHKLNIEVGRPINLPLNERICQFCNMDIEDGKHILLNCYLYDNLCETLFDNVTKNLPYFNEFNTVTQFIILFNARRRVAVHVARFVYDAFISRKATS